MKKEVFGGWRIIFSITGASGGAEDGSTVTSGEVSTTAGGGALLFSSARVVDWAIKFSSEVAWNVLFRYR